MKALAIVLVLCLSGVARAADDAPLASPEVPAVGGTLSADSLCLSSEEQLKLAQRLESDKATITSLKADAGKVQPLPIILTAVIAIGLGAAIGFGVSKAVK